MGNDRKKIEYLQSLLRQRWEQAKPVGRLLDVAARHGQVLSPASVPEGVGPDSEVRLIDGGLNGKRPQYIVAASDGALYPVHGYLMGRESSLHVLDSVYYLRRGGEVRPNFRLSPAEETELNFL